ncbi:MAG: PaaI family thioesterase [Lacibacter sp.]
MNPQAQQFIRLMRHPLHSRLFMLLKLPAAYFSGVRIRQLTPERAVVSVPYKWFSQNPFRSTYFACLAMAAEMSTGLLALMQLYKRKPAVSMLVVKLEAHYFKKATGLTSFVCEAGADFERIVDECIRTGAPLTYVATAVGRNEADELVAEFFITWSFKAKV